jgi:hypothetical protein
MGVTDARRRIIDRRLMRGSESGPRARAQQVGDMTQRFLGVMLAFGVVATNAAWAQVPDPEASAVWQKVHASVF